MNTRQKRFRIALSFPGEHRDFVRRVAERLASGVGRDQVLYDQYYEAEFARPNLDTHLQRLYHDESDAIAVFLCADYERKEWCGLEWRAIRDVIKQRRDSDVMPLRFDNTEIPGLFSIDGYIWIGERTPEQIAGLILQRISVPPSTRGASAQISPSRLRHSAAKLFGRADELAALDEAWSNPATNVLSIVAWGGVGKTSLVATWAAQLAGRDYDGARYFDWSFYSQGTRDQTSASSDAFIAKALQFFGDAQMAESPTSPWDKGARLAQLVAQERTLLVLDGLEPMQYPPGPLAGELRDPALAALLRGLAQRNLGLCVVTTRERVTDLGSFHETTAPEWKLDRLTVRAGANLLESLAIHGMRAEIEQLVEDVKGHALTLNLLGRYLSRAHGGDVRRRDRVHFDKADANIQGGHAFRAMAAYARWLSEGGEMGTRQLAILSLLGLFDRPADAGCLAALRKRPVITGLTEPLVDLNEDDWNLAIASLSDCNLVSWGTEDADETAFKLSALDAHPLIREYFANRLRTETPDAWKVAHSRLFDYLKDTVEPTPATLAGLQPLYQAVAHGCQAGRHQEACDDVYYARILRGPETYSFKKLGASGADLGALVYFFEQPWRQVSPLLSESDQVWLLAEAGFRLRALGRLNEALEPTRAALHGRIEAQSWQNASIGAGNLSELTLALGELDAALAYAEQARTYASEGNAPERIASLASVADVLHQANRRDEALTYFQAAEALQAEFQPQYPLLYSFQGFGYCDLLLAEAERAAWRSVLAPQKSSQRLDASVECDKVLARGQKMFEWRVPSDSLLDVALDHLTVGRAAFYSVRLRFAESEATSIDAENLYEAARQQISTALDCFRRAGTNHHLPNGLLARAWLRAVEGDPAAAQTDLDEAWAIAQRGSMRLFQADIHLYRARLFHATDPYPWETPQVDLAAARMLIEQCGYWRRKEELEDAEAAIFSHT